MKKFKNITEVDSYVTKKVSTLEKNITTCIFLGGSFVRGEETKLSDIDYTVCVDSKLSHPRFQFELIEVAGVFRLLSVYYFTYEEFLISRKAIGDEDFLWMPKFLPQTRFVSGDEEVYKKGLEFYSNLTYTRAPKDKTVHKSFGKLLELIARIKKWNKKGDFVEMVYYGRKLAEHTRRLVVEINGPISVNSENQYLEEHFNLKHLPRNYKKNYLIVNRYSEKAIAFDDYEKACVSLVKSLVSFLKKNVNLVDPWTASLLKEIKLSNYIDLH